MRTAIIGAVLVLGACAGGHADDEGPRAQRSFDVATFDRIALAGSHDVIVTVGSAPSVRAEGSERALEHLEIDVKDGRLRIRSRERSGWFSFGRHRSATVHVTVPALTETTVAGSGDVRIDRLVGPSFLARIAGSGELEIGAMQVREATFAVAGSGHIRAAGAAERTQLNIAGSGDVDLSALRSRTATVSIAGSGDARLNATETAEVEIRGSGNVAVAGGARCSVDKRGSGNVRCG